MIHSQNSASYFRENQMLLPHHTHARVGIAFMVQDHIVL